MIDSYGRSLYQKAFLDKLVKTTFVQGLSPTFDHNFCRLSCENPSFCPLLAFGFSWCAWIFLVFSGFLDTLDGSIARHRKMSSDSGAVFDITADRLVEFAVILGLYFVDPSQRGLYSLLMLGSILICITSFLVVGMSLQNKTEKSFFYSPGLIERTKPFFLDDPLSSSFYSSIDCIYYSKYLQQQ